MTVSTGRTVCPVCGEPGTVAVSWLAATRQCVFRCPVCWLEFAHPFILDTPADGVAHSTVTDPGYIQVMRYGHDVLQSIARVRATNRLALYARILEVGTRLSILEVGSGSGWLVREFASAGACSLGLELDPELVASARAIDAPVVEADICTIDPGQFGVYDVVCCGQTLEHIVTPQMALQNMIALLRPSGLLHVDVPNGDSWGARLRRIRRKGTVWGALAPPAHQIGYHPKSLARLFADSGLVTVAILQRPTDDPAFGQTILPASLRSRLTMKASGYLGHGYLLVGLARTPELLN